MFAHLKIIAHKKTLLMYNTNFILFFVFLNHTCKTKKSTKRKDTLLHAKQIVQLKLTKISNTRHFNVVVFSCFTNLCTILCAIFMTSYLITFFYGR